jgi:hypothetical protein
MVQPNQTFVCASHGRELEGDFWNVLAFTVDVPAGTRRATSIIFQKFYVRGMHDPSHVLVKLLTGYLSSTLLRLDKGCLMICVRECREGWSVVVRCRSSPGPEIQKPRPSGHHS